MLSEPAFNGLRKAIGKSDYIAHAGVYTGLIGAYWVELVKKENDLVFIRNLNDVGKTKLPKVEEWVEECLVYPLTRGRDIKEFISRPSIYMILPVDKYGKTITENEMKENYAHSFLYFNKLKSNLLKRNGEPYKSWFKSEPQKAPFYAIFNATNSFSKYKVGWAEISGSISGKAELRAGLIESNEDKAVIPNQKCMFIPTDDYYESLYILGILNSSISKLIVASYSIETHIEPDIMNVIRIEKYDKGNINHTKIAETVKKIRDEISLKGDISNLKLELDKLVSNLYGISQEELDEIRMDMSLLLNTSEKDENTDLDGEDPQE